MKTCVFAMCALLAAAPSFAQETVPEIAFDSIPDFFKLPAEMNFGEVPGVAVDSKGRIYVFTRSNSAYGPAFGATAAQLFVVSATLLSVPLIYQVINHSAGVAQTPATSAIIHDRREIGGAA